jgi:hypothetical protein
MKQKNLTYAGLVRQTIEHTQVSHLLAIALSELASVQWLRQLPQGCRIQKVQVVYCFAMTNQHSYFFPYVGSKQQNK